MNFTTEKKILFGIILFTVIGLLVFLFYKSKPKLSIMVADLGRDHIQIGESVNYNSNPPTSGPHYVEWAKSQIYTSPPDDRNLVHSLEHGYVIISYNCAYQPQGLIPTSYAHEEDALTVDHTDATNSATESAALPNEFSSENCSQLVSRLTQTYNEKGPYKLILAPRPNLDAKIALTAWRYIDKFNDFDKNRIIKFIDTHRNQGPEKTVE